MHSSGPFLVTIKKKVRLSMLIQCTKKLLDQLKVTPEPTMEEVPLFSWHANLITINRRKTVVLINNQNRYVMILYGLKSKELERMDEVILEGILQSCREENVAEEVIEKYLQRAGSITFSKRMTGL